MKRYIGIPVLASIAILTLGAAPARAQSEVTPFVSLGSVNSSRAGAAIRFAWTSDLSLEAEVGYRRDAIDALSTSLSLLYDGPRIGRVVPYLAGGVGLEQFAYAIGQPSGLVATHSSVAFTVNAGGGVRVPLNSRWGYRSDVRWVNNLSREGGEHWRVYNGVTFKTGAR
jgi:opacity protein-like surface antigen